MIPLPQILSDWLYTSWRKARRAFLPAPAPFCSLLSQDFVRAAASFQLADPRRPFFNAPLPMAQLAERASQLLCDQAESLERAALELETQHQHASRAGPAEIQRGYFLISLERQRQQLAREREALCLLAHGCQLVFDPLGAPPPADAEHGENGPALRPVAMARALDAPHSLLGGQTLLCFFISARHVELCSLLLDLGANGSAPSADGDSPLALAERKARAMEGRSGEALSESRQAQRIANLLQRDALERSCAKSSLSQRETRSRL